MEQRNRQEPVFSPNPPLIIEGEVVGSKILPFEEEEPHRWIRAGAAWRVKSWRDVLALVIHLMLAWVFLFFTLPIIGPLVRALVVELNVLFQSH
jgi:hypothetical protein